MGRYNEDEHTDYAGNGLGMRSAYYGLILGCWFIGILYVIHYFQEKF
ncbi:hypothetical protein NDK47_23795 [Brevibacillus ruminantium]|uniref:Uncharacterized protein n=1 Tax=Brevibacillus ruminantium TaxID=2950604 RepID=A0ABY4WDZ1_9BACL|nr:hypothetical protein [Brevibacillus ruminantium]USG65109.1 hypothetical protein NDK47_23795 [Brevibacillus ruminantium]